MSDPTAKPDDVASVIEMPGVLISNQSQQLNTGMNERFNDLWIWVDLPKSINELPRSSRGQNWSTRT